MKIFRHVKGFSSLLLLTMFSSCTDNNNSSSVNKSIVGTWSWVKTDGGIAFNIHDTPESTGKNIDINFFDNSRYFVYTNGVLSEQGTYRLGSKISIVDHSTKTTVQFSKGEEMMIEKIDGLNLELSQNANDGIGSSYLRKK